MKALISFVLLSAHSVYTVAQTTGTTSVSDIAASSFSMLFTLAIPVAIIYFGWEAYKQRQELAKMNYDWYVSHVPLVNGKVVCRYCGSNKIMVKNGRNNSNIRTHYCGQCGQGLYYSFEDWRI